MKHITIHDYKRGYFGIARDVFGWPQKKVGKKIVGIGSKGSERHRGWGEPDSKGAYTWGVTHLHGLSNVRV